MKRIKIIELRINSCLYCSFCDVNKYFCKKMNLNIILEQEKVKPFELYDIPKWCPLPSAT